MTWSATLFGAALRVMRAAAGRRALQVALLVGGMFVLGVLYGERAQAADGVPTAHSAEAASSASASIPAYGARSLTESPVGRVVSGPAQHGPHASARPVGTAEQAVHRPTAPAEAAESQGRSRNSEGGSTTASRGLPAVTDQVPSVGDRAVPPADDLVRTVSERLGELREKAPPASLPLVPGLPDSPSMPGGSVLPGLPALPGPPGNTLPAPVTPAPQPGSSTVPPVGGHGSDGRGGAAAVKYGPTFAGAGWTDSAPHRDERRAVSGHAPAQQTPAGDAYGALGSRSAADNGTSRHSDGHAVTLNHRAPLRLVPGAAARTDAAETRDRYRDIPVSPA